MTFLAIGPAEALALAAVTAAVVAWLFFLRLRHPRLPVGSLLLWRRAVEKHRPQALVERLRRLVSLAVALAIGLLLALAPARPATGGGAAAGGRALALVVDTSPSMASRGPDGVTRLERAVARARELVVGAPAGTAVGLADTSGTVRLAAGVPRSELVRALDGLGVGPPGRTPLASGGRDERVVFITDGVGRDPYPEGATRISVFEPAANVGIVAFAISPVPSAPRTFEAFVDVVNASREPKAVTLTIGDAPASRIVRRLEIPAGGHAREAIDATKLEPGAVRASIAAEGDGFALDDSAFAWMPSPARAKTVLVTAGNRPLETLLSLDERVDLTTISPAQFQPLAGTDVYVFDGFAPAVAPDAPALLIHPQPVGWLASIVDIAGEVAAPSITGWQAHPVLAFVPATDIRVDRALDLRLAPGAEEAGARAIAAAGPTALIVTAVRPAKLIILGFDLADSDFAFQLGFPLFVENAIGWLAGARAPIEAAPGTVRVPWLDAEIVAPGGGPVAARRAIDGTVFEAPGPGVYEARRGGDRQPIVVRLDDASVSDVNRSSLTGAAPLEDVEARGRELWTPMLLGALFLVIVEWWTFHRRITV